MHNLGRFLHEKKFGLPIWAWALVIAGVVFALYWWHKKHSAATSQDTSNATPLDAGAAAAQPDSEAGSGGGGGGIPDLSGIGSASVPYTVDSTPYPYFDIGAGGEAPVQLSPDGSSSSTQTAQPSQTASSSLVKIAETPVSAKNPNFAQAAQARTAAGQASGTAVPFGGVVGVTKLKSGATLTTYATGRQVEQAPGKSAYVTKKGSTAPLHPGQVL